MVDRPVVDWDDVRFFLAVARGGSVRAAADALGVTHSTVLRRVAQLEARLGARLFEKLPAGYRPTEAGREIVALAEQMDAASHQLEARVAGRDQGLRGLLRVTMAPVLASHLLMPDLAAFAREHPEIEVEVLSGDEPLNLTNREADVAVRVAYNTVPPNLHGRRGPEVFGAAYLARTLLDNWRAHPAERVRWVVKRFDGVPDWAREGAIPVAPVPFRTVDTGAHIAAVRAGLGMTALPCFVGDADPELVRVPGTELHRHGTLWLLTGADARRTARVQAFTRFMARCLAVHAPLLAGAAHTAG